MMLPTQERMSMAVSELVNAVNTMGSEKAAEAGAVMAFRTSHRTLQQNLMRVMIIPILRHLATCAENGTYDLRNEDSCKLAQKMLAAVEEHEQYVRFV